jgi:hypothetical protein
MEPAGGGHVEGPVRLQKAKQMSRRMPPAGVMPKQAEPRTHEFVNMQAPPTATAGAIGIEHCVAAPIAG